MHIDPGVVDGAKLMLSYSTAAGVVGYTAWLAWGMLRQARLPELMLRSMVAMCLVFCFFEVLPHYKVGVSEVHLIMGAAIFLILGAAPAAIGLASGLLLQGLLFAPADLPQYGMNLTTLLVPLFALNALSRQMVPAGTPFGQMSYQQCLVLSAAYQGGVIAWVAFWALYGQGVNAASLAGVAQFGSAYLPVILIECGVCTAWLAMGRHWPGLVDSRLFGGAFSRVTQA